MNLIFLIPLLVCGVCRWSIEKATEWYNKQPWLVGVNYIPSTAVNQLEMWQPETFDLVTIDRELGWAQDLGFNTVRVFLHYLLWKDDKEGLYIRMDKFLKIATRHNITTAFVFLDDCWTPHPKLGKQPEPIPHLHNSRWLKSPGVDISQNLDKQNLVAGYIKDTLRRFANDKRIVMWDLYNEPGNTNPFEYSAPLLQKAFRWAREVNPSQPLIAALWDSDWSHPANIHILNEIMINESDILAFHDYSGLEFFNVRYEGLKKYGRPVICNEWMSRSSGSTIETILPFMKEKKIGAYSWGFVAGKTQTNYPWDTWVVPIDDEPPLWFHDILRQDGTPYNKTEVAIIKSITG